MQLCSWKLKVDATPSTWGAIVDWDEWMCIPFICSAVCNTKRHQYIINQTLTLRYFPASLHHCDCDAVHAVKYAATPWIGLLVSQKTGIWWSRRSTSRSLPFYLKDCIHLWAILMAVWVTNLRGPERVRTPISSHCLTTSDCYSRTRLSWTVSSRQVAEETNFFTTVWTQAMMRCFT